MNAAGTYLKLRALLSRRKQHGLDLSAGRRCEGAIGGSRGVGPLSWLLLLLLLLGLFVSVFRGLDRIDLLRVCSERQNGNEYPDAAFRTIHLHLR